MSAPLTLEEIIQHYGFPIGPDKAHAIANGIRAHLAGQSEYMRDDHDRSLIAALLGVTTDGQVR